MNNLLKKPEWLILKKYDESKEFSKKDWFEQISLRFLLYSVATEQLKEDTFIKMFNDIKEHIYPENPHGVIAFMQTFQNPSMHKFAMDNELYQTNLWSTTIKEVLQLPRINTNQENFNFESGKPIDLLYIDDDIIGRKHLTVDLNANLEELQDDFKSWVTHAKRQFDANEKRHIINDSHERLWAQHRVLSYLDLLIWCRLNEFEIKNHGDTTYTELVQWVYDDRFPNGVTRETIRNIKRYEKEMMNFNFLIRLYKYAYGTTQHESLIEVIKRFSKLRGLDLRQF